MLHAGTLRQQPLMPKRKEWTMREGLGELTHHVGEHVHAALALDAVRQQDEGLEGRGGVQERQTHELVKHGHSWLCLHTGPMDQETLAVPAPVNPAAAWRAPHCMLLQARQ